jgi:hypothetical protein
MKHQIKRRRKNQMESQLGVWMSIQKELQIQFFLEIVQNVCQSMLYNVQTLHTLHMAQ